MPRRAAPKLLLALALVPSITLTGCGGHYRVVDSASGRVFYTRHLDRTCEGTTHFVDVRNCQEVSLQSAQVDGITPAEFDRRTAW